MSNTVTTMQKDIQIFGQTVTIDIFLNVFEQERSTKFLTASSIDDFNTMLERQRQITFAVERYTPRSEQKRFYVNGVSYNEIRGTYEVHNGTPYLNVIGQKVDGANGSNGLTTAAREKFSEALQPVLAEAYPLMDQLRDEVWTEYFKRIEHAANEAERHAANLRTLIVHHNRRETGTFQKWKTLDGHECAGQWHANRQAAENGDKEYIGETYQIKGGVLLVTNYYATVKV